MSDDFNPPVPAAETAHEAVQEDYFGVRPPFRVILPKKNPAAADSWIEFEHMTEGKRKAYNKALGRDIRIESSSRDAIMKAVTGEEKTALIKALACAWNLQRGGKPIGFSSGELNMFLDVADPAVIDHIDRELRKEHPFLDGEPTLEEIDKGIDDLQELRRKLVEKQEGK